VAAGSVVGFLGPNGAGKSTTLKMIAGYLTPDAGSIVVHGIDVVKDPIAAKKHIGYLAEANPLYFDMYVKEYLSFIGKAHTLTEVSNAVANCIELTGLGAESHKKIGQLSKGYKQRVGLAAALIHNPQVLLLDEPTSGLDPNQIIEIRNVIQVQGAVKTVLFSSHILQEVEAICERALILSKGQIVANDSLSNLLHNKSQSLESVFRSLTSGLETPIIT
jgi:ABC-2 type transport system ATP-binding protein